MKKLLPILFVLIITSCSKEIPSDQLVKRSDLYYEVNSKKPFTGKIVMYHENGQLKYKGSLSDGVYIGLHQGYCQNGETSLQLNYPSGLHQSWSCGTGTLHWEGNYKNGFKEGTWTNYDSRGEIFYINNYKEGKKHGLQEDYLCDGQVKEREIYDEGKKVYIEEYDYGGNLEKKYCFLNKMECSKFQFPPNVKTRNCR